MGCSCPSLYSYCVAQNKRVAVLGTCASTLARTSRLWGASACHVLVHHSQQSVQCSQVDPPQQMVGGTHKGIDRGQLIKPKTHFFLTSSVANSDTINNRSN